MHNKIFRMFKYSIKNGRGEKFNIKCLTNRTVCTVTDFCIHFYGQYFVFWNHLYRTSSFLTKLELMHIDSNVPTLVISVRAVSYVFANIFARRKTSIQYVILSRLSFSFCVQKFCTIVM